MRYAMIMAGGAGTRLWPMSRANRPKQLLRIIHRPGEERARSLLELASGRLDGLIPQDRLYICTNEAYREPIKAELPAFTDERILGEPAGRDTVNAVGFAAAVFQKMDPDAVFAAITADHLIEPDDVFRARMDLAFRLVEQDPGRLVTFSITPTYAATSYGYVERGTPIADVEGSQGLVHKVARFVEKPDLPRAQAYFQSGVFGWNSGMFVWKAATVMEALERFMPESHAGLVKIQEAWGTDRQRAVLEEVYPTLPKISVDYAIMEPIAKLRPPERRFQIVTVQMDVRWLDVGSWTSYGETLEPDAAGNRVGGGAVVARGRNNLVVNQTPGHTIALLGCDDLVVVHTPDATLVVPRSKATDLKELHEQVPDELK